MVALHWLHVPYIGCMCAMLVALHNGWSSFPLLLPVKETVVTTKDGESLIEWDLVKVAPLVKSPGYGLRNDDTGAYSGGEDFDGFCPDRE